MYLRIRFEKSMLAFVAFLLILAGGVLAKGSRNGRATWFRTGLGACGAWNNNGEKIVALGPLEYAGGNHCFQKIKVHYQGKTVTAKVVDLCPSCGLSGIDLSMTAFQALAPLDVGVLQVTWEYV